MNNMINDDMTINSANIIHAIFIGHHTTRARTSVFHADLSAIRHALLLHGIPHNDMSLFQCRQALIHHIITACFDNPSNSRDAFSSIRGLRRLKEDEVLLSFEVRKSLLNGLANGRLKKS
jgi:hypothetical protein